ncbi:MAG: TonB family protein [Saprospiraceae bacterium]
MKALIYLFIVVSFAACFTVYPGTKSAPTNVFLDKYRSRVEPGSLLLNAGYHFSLEQTTTGACIYKIYFPETGQITDFITYTDKTLRTKSGKHIAWYDNGNKFKEGMNKNNQEEGFWQYYEHRSGKLSHAGNYVNGKREGSWKYLDTLGRLRSEYNYKNDLQHGVYHKYDSTGTLIETGEYREDQLIRQEKYRADDFADEGDILKKVEQLPTMQTCMTIQDSLKRKQCSDRTMLEYVYRNVRYPAIAREMGIEGMVVTSFVVEKDGSMTDIVISRGLCQSIKDECMRIVKNMPAWSPGTQNGRPVRVQFNLPIRFKLE